MIFTVSIAGVSAPVEIYGGLTAATDYIGAKFGPAPLVWLALSGDDKAKTLRTATVYLDEQPWQGAATGTVPPDPTTLAWPRSGVLIDSVPVDSTFVPVDIVTATFELAIAITQKPTVVDLADQGSNIRTVGGGGAPSVTYFAPTSAALGTAGVMPVPVQRLVAKYLALLSSTELGGFSQAGSPCSRYRHNAQFNLRFPEG